eukprot:TRINITY_DN30080_c0_g2_i1.p1 TRINITY_DN30080_c0_g2~~TRINITY_DN30080_c0_g2_i1.p1  ORF type:complete len:698 (-),score=195.64 TRINITY_DN30080_c0_g2_i1:363-2456(-)
MARLFSSAASLNGARETPLTREQLCAELQNLSEELCSQLKQELRKEMDDALSSSFASQQQRQSSKKLTVQSIFGMNSDEAKSSCSTPRTPPPDGNGVFNNHYRPYRTSLMARVESQCRSRENEDSAQPLLSRSPSAASEEGGACCESDDSDEEQRSLMVMDERQEISATEAPRRLSARSGSTIKTDGSSCRTRYGVGGNRIKSVVLSPCFDYFACAMVLLNSMIIGLQTDYMAKHVGEDVPMAYNIANEVMNAGFAVEIGLRIYALGMDFFTMQDMWKWNWFDFGVVVLQVFESALCFFFKQVITVNFAFFRLVRILRVLRIIRLVRVLHLITELRTMVSSIAGSLKALFWSLLLLALLTYAAGVCFTQMVNERRLGLGPDALQAEELVHLDKHFGSLASAVLSIWECISGGMEWERVATLLMNNVSTWTAVAFVLYVAFCTLAVLNIVTGVFVEYAMTSVSEEKDVDVAKNVIQLFKKSALNENGELSWEVFQESLATPEVQQLFQTVNVDRSEAHGLFKLIDTEKAGAVGPDQLMNGWLRLRGPAKSLDMQLLIYEVEELHRDMIMKTRALGALAEQTQELVEKMQEQQDLMMKLAALGQQRKDSDSQIGEAVGEGPREDMSQATFSPESPPKPPAVNSLVVPRPARKSFSELAEPARAAGETDAPVPMQASKLGRSMRCSVHPNFKSRVSVLVR